MSEPNGALFAIGAGPGIGRSVTIRFASEHFKQVALFAKRGESLAAEKKAIEEAVDSAVEIKTYTVDVADPDALIEALDAADADLGKPACVFYNAARVLPSKLLEHDVNEIELDLKINVSALYTVAQRTLPHLLNLAKTGTWIRPALIVTSSLLPQHPNPDVFSLSLAKAAQRNLMESLSLTYGSKGVVLGLINVGGRVSPEAKSLNPTNIANKTWEWFTQENPGFEVVIPE